MSFLHATCVDYLTYMPTKYYKKNLKGHWNYGLQLEIL